MRQILRRICEGLLHQYRKITSSRRFESPSYLIISAGVAIVCFLFFSKGFCPFPGAKNLRWIFPALLVLEVIQGLYKNQIGVSYRLRAIARLILLLISLFYLSRVSPRFHQTDPIGTLFTGYFSWLFLLDRFALYLSILASFHCVGALMSPSFWRGNNLLPTLLSIFVGTAIVYFTVYAALALHLEAFLAAKCILLLALGINVLYESIKLIRKSPELVRKCCNLSVIPFVVYAFFIVAAIDVFIGKILNPFHRDGDVWLHYLPYYLEVFQKQSWGPGELWYHFYCSKGAILQFLTLYFSGGDIYSLRIFQFLFFLLSCFFLLNQLAKKSQKIIFSVALMLVMQLIKASDTWGFFGKSHEVVFACILVIMGCLAGLGAQKNIKANCFLIIAFSGMIGMLTPPLSVPLFCSLVTLSFLTSSEIMGLKRTLQVSAFFVAIQFIGQIVYNQWTTGLMMETPIRLAWALSNPQKIHDFFDPYLVQYLILGSSRGVGTVSLSNLFSSLGLIFNLLKITDFIKVCGPALFVFIVVLTPYYFKSFLKRRIKYSPTVAFLVILISFTSALGLLAGQAISLGRILSFASLGVSLFAATGLLFYLAKTTFYKKSGVKLLFVVLLFLSFSQFAINTDLSFASRTRDVFRWISGKTKSWELSKKVNPASESWMKLKNMLPPSDKIFCLTIISGPENVTQGNYVKSEVSHSFGPDWAKMVFGTPEESQSVLDKNNIRYIAVEKYAFSFGAFPFSKYIDSWIMYDDRKDIVYEDDYLICVKTKSTRDIQEKTKELKKTLSAKSMSEYIMSKQKPGYRPASVKMETLRNVMFQIWTANNGIVQIHLPAELPKDMGWQ
jgi:hypothetical protein